MDPTNTNTALASAMVEELARSGLRDAVICPGSRSTPLALALWREPSIEARVIVDERSAGFFALGAAQATRRPTAVLCTSGTAAANLHPAVCEADESAVPLLVLTADRPPELRGIGAGQTIDQLKLYGAAVRWFCELGTHAADDSGLLHFRSVACRGFAVAAGDPRPGPVHLNVAWRDPLGPVPRPGEVVASSALALEGRDAGRPLTSYPRAPAPAAEPLTEAIAERVAGTERGLIIAGRMDDPEAPEALAALARAAGYPILAEPTSQLRLGSHDRSRVVRGYEPIARARAAALAPELVLRFGELPTCKPLRGWLAELEGASQILIDPSRGFNEPTRIASAIVRADPAPVAAGVAARVGGPREGSWLRAWLDAGAAAAEAIEAELARLDGPTEPGVQAALGALYADGDLVYTASSMPIRDQEAFLPTGPAAVRFLANRGANGIDGLLSSGVGAAAASGRPTWIVTGDLGLFHDMNALAAVRHATAPLRIVVLNNDGGGIFEFLPQAGEVGRSEFEALLGTPLGLDPARIAAVHDLPHHRIAGLDELAAAALQTGMIEVPVDREANVGVHDRLGAAAARAVAEAVGA